MISSNDALLIKYISEENVEPKIKDFFYKNMDLFINNREEFKELFEKTLGGKWDILIFNVGLSKNKNEIYNVINSQISPELIEMLLKKLFNSKEKVIHDMIVNDFKVTLSIEVEE